MQSIPVTTVLVNEAVTAAPQLSVNPLIASVALNGAAVAALAMHASVPEVPAYGVPVNAGAVGADVLFDFSRPRCDNHLKSKRKKL